MTALADLRKLHEDGLPIPWDYEGVLLDIAGAAQEAADELGVPGPDYPAPIANAANILRTALARLESPDG